MRPKECSFYGVNWPLWSEIDDFQSIFARSTSSVTPSEKSLINTNRKSTMHFPMSLRWTSYVVPKPSKGGSKPQNGRFLCKIALQLKKVCYKISLCENVNDKVVRHLLAYLSVQKWLLGDAPLNVNFALSEPVLGAAAMLISAFTTFDEYSICIAVITMEYEITNNVYQLN